MGEKTEVLTVATFEQICRTQLLIRVLESCLGRGRRGVRVDIDVFWRFQDETIMPERFFKLRYAWREPNDGSIDPLQEASDPQCLELEELGIENLDIINPGPNLVGRVDDMLRAWGEKYPLSWCTTKPIVVFRDRGGAYEELSASDFYILEHLVRLHTQIAFRIQSGHPTAGALWIAGNRLFAMIRRQQQKWRLIGIRQQRG